MSVEKDTLNYIYEKKGDTMRTHKKKPVDSENNEMVPKGRRI